MIKLNKCTFFIKKIRLCLNTQSDSIRTKLFIEFCYFFTYIFYAFTCIFYAFTCIFYALSPRTVHIKLSNLIFFSLENDDMESSKHCYSLVK